MRFRTYLALTIIWALIVMAVTFVVVYAGLRMAGYQ